MKTKISNISNKKTRKGFIFTLLVLVIIVFMIAELNIYFRTYQLRQESEPAKIRSFVIADFADQLSQKKLSNVAYVIGYNALYYLSNDSSSPSPSSSNLNSTVWSLMWNGTRSDLVGNPKKIDQTLSAWNSNLTTIASRVGFNITTSYNGFNITQVDPWTVQFNFTFSYNLTDSTSAVKIVSSYPITFNVSIQGFNDPAISRAFSGATVVRRDIFNTSSTSWTNLFSTGQYGKGWFYGEPVKITAAAQVNFSSDSKKKILVTDSSEIWKKYANVYGAVVIVGSQNIQSAAEVDFIGVPVFVNQSISLVSIPNSPFLIISDNDTVATETQGTSYHKLYDIETARSLAVCALYSNNADALSFLGRLTNTTAADPFGIETMYAGMGGWLTNPGRSAIDHAYVAGAAGTKIMGMAGCHDRISCNPSFSPDFVNPMALDAAHAARYGLTDLICTGTRCG